MKKKTLKEIPKGNLKQIKGRGSNFIIEDHVIGKVETDSIIIEDNVIGKNSI